MIKVGLTGGIGSGKSTVAKLFKELGVPIFNSDLSAREAENVPYIQEGYKKILGNDIFIDGKLDRAKMRSIVFVDKDKLKQINDLVIPFVSNEFDKFSYSKINEPYIILESAILFETGNNEKFDVIITVTADTDIRIRRVYQRDKISLDDIDNKMNNQWPDNLKIAKSDCVIINNGLDLIDSLDILTKQVDIVDKAIRYVCLSAAIDKIYWTK